MWRLQGNYAIGTSESSDKSKKTKATVATIAVVILVIAGVAYVQSGHITNSLEASQLAHQENIVISQYSCPAGTYETGRTASGACMCKLCAAGYECAGGVSSQQVPCNVGKYQSLVGQSSCLNASPGSCVPTIAATGVTPCVAGTYQAQTGQGSCIPASPGHDVPQTGATGQTSCGPGYFQPAQGQTHCIPSPRGSYVNTDSATTTMPCHPGTYQPQTAQTSCIPASPGYYVWDSGSFAAKPCPAGFYQPSSGKVTCFPSSSGHMVPDGGSSVQTPCPENTFQSCGSQTACTPCLDGTALSGSTSCISAHPIVPAPPVSSSSSTTSSTTTTTTTAAPLSMSVSNVCVPCFGSKSTQFAPVTVPKTGNLRSVTLTYVSGLWKLCGNKQVAGCTGRFGIAGVNHQFTTFIAKTNYAVVTPLLNGGTTGVTPLQSGMSSWSPYPYYKLSGKNAATSSSITLSNTNPVAVTQGEVLRIYNGEVLFQYQYLSDNLGTVCFNLTFNIQ